MSVRQPLTQGEIESMILDRIDMLEEATFAYRDALIDAVNADADYELARGRVMMGLANAMTPGGKSLTVADRQARCDVMTTTEYRKAKLAEAVRNSLREAMLSHRTTIDALRTLSANVRAQT